MAVEDKMVVSKELLVSKDEVKTALTEECGPHCGAENGRVADHCPKCHAQVSHTNAEFTGEVDEPYWESR